MRTHVLFLGVGRQEWNNLKNVEERIVIGFDRKRSLIAELRQPTKSHHSLQGHVLVAVGEVTLNQITVLAELFTQTGLKR